jgi:signal peptidase I
MLAGMRWVLCSGAISLAAICAGCGTTVTVVIVTPTPAPLQFHAVGEAMFPAIHNGQTVLVDRNSYVTSAPARGDIVVFRAVNAGQPNVDFIKRVIGLPGENVEVMNNAVYINGKRLAESYIPVNERPQYTFPSQTVPPGDYFVLGDNRNNSQDSHLWRWLSGDYIVGKVIH